MDDERVRCAELAIGERADYWGITPADLPSRDNGHHFHQGWHIGWKWGIDPARGLYLDFLDEHRMAGISARRVFPDGTVETIGAPGEMRLMGTTPDEDARLEREFFEYNRAAYAGLRERGLLPPEGTNLVSQDINEFLQTGGDPSPPDPA